MSCSSMALGRLGVPSEIAKAVVFLASDEAPFTVGSELIIDGGMAMLLLGLERAGLRTARGLRPGHREDNGGSR